MEGVIGIASVAAIVFSLFGGPHGTNELWFTNTDARVEKLYADGGRIVDTPLMKADAAMAVCANGYEVRRELTEIRGNQTFLVWELRCR